MIITPPEKEDPYSITLSALNSKNAVVELNNSICDIKTRQILQFNNEFEMDFGCGGGSTNGGGGTFGDVV